MKVLDDHHHYLLKNFENAEEVQTLKFIKKEMIPEEGITIEGEGKGEMKTIHDGTTNEEVLEMLIHRCQGLYAKFPSRETAIAITHMEEALMWFEKRTKDRIKRGVEGKHLK